MTILCWCFVFQASLKGMSFSSGVQGSLRGSSCYSSFELCPFSFVWLLEAKKKCSSRSADLSFLCNFKPISSPFLHEQSQVRNFFFYFGFISPLGCRVGLGTWVISSAQEGQPGARATCVTRVLCCSWAQLLCPFLHLLRYPALG